MTATFATPVVLTSQQFTDALFAASLACGCLPTQGQVMETVTSTIRRHGVEFCAAAVAGEYGDHPEVAVLRMRRVLDLLDGLSFMAIEATRPE